MLLAIDGLAYLIWSFQRLPCAELGRPPDALDPVAGARGEGILSLWLLTFGVNVEWWTRRASGETRMRFAKVETLR